MKILKSTWFPPKGYTAITLAWWIIVRTNAFVTERLVRHESIHWEQQKETLILPFFLWYAVEFVVRLVLCRNWNKAYRSISFEREAYANENDETYLAKRKHFSFIKYL